MLKVEVIGPGRARVFPTVFKPLAGKVTLRVLHRVSFESVDNVITSLEPGQSYDQPISIKGLPQSGILDRVLDGTGSGFVDLPA